MTIMVICQLVYYYCIIVLLLLRVLSLLLKVDMPVITGNAPGDTIKEHRQAVRIANL